MAAEQRKLLEQLMGEQLMSMPGATKQTQLQITDKTAHLPNLREQFQNASDDEKRQWGFEFDYMRDISKHVSGCDRRIDDAQSRLEQTPEEIRKSTALLKQISELTRTIEAGLLEVEILSEEGAVNLAVQEFHKVKQARLEREDREQQHNQLMDNSGPSGHQKLQVCEVCAAYLSRLDNDRRLLDHFLGRLHLGFQTMRKEYERLQKELKGRQPPPRPVEEDRRDNGYDDGYGGGYGGNQGYGRRGGRRGGFGGGRQYSRY